MIPSARISGAIEVLADIESKRRPANDALKEWGQMHRFAGSGDRAAIAGLVYDALRRRASAAYVMGDTAPRAVVLGMLRLERDLEVDAIAAMFDGSRFAPEPLSDGEREKLVAASLQDAPPHIAGDYPDWLDTSFATIFGEARVQELAALASRAPLDLRVNLLKADRDRASAELGEYNPEQTSWSPVGLRISVPPDAKSPAIQSDPAFIKGHVEIQDEGSQLAALLSGAQPGEQVVDLCAGAGGKTLALAAMMENSGQLYATDTDKRRLAPIHARLERAGVRNVQVRTPRGAIEVLDDLAGKIDLVLIDAPCTGTGSWRRNPDAKWRLRPRRAGDPPQGPGRRARPRGAAAQAGRPHRLCDLLGAGGGKWRADPRFSSSATPNFPWKSRRPSPRPWASAAICSSRRRWSRTLVCS